ncbi:Uncharacterised protein [Acinetobacter baumannii]|nr:Uncharacterised protein [Acinetobacter baumannii]
MRKRRDTTESLSGCPPISRRSALASRFSCGSSDALASRTSASATLASSRALRCKGDSRITRAISLAAR